MPRSKYVQHRLVGGYPRASVAVALVVAMPKGNGRPLCQKRRLHFMLPRLGLGVKGKTISGSFRLVGQSMRME